MKTITLRKLKRRLPNSKNMGGILAKLILWLFIFGVFYLFLFPFIYLLSTAFQSEASVNDPSVLWLPTSLTMDNIKQVIELLNYDRSIVLTFTIAIFSTLASIASCSLVGYGFARFNFKGKGFAFALVILTIILPIQTVLIPNYLNFRFFDFFGILKIVTFGLVDHINLVETPWTFILPAIFANGLRGGLFIFIFRQSFASLPKELEEAAKIDGCGSFETYVKIMFPLASAAVITVSLFSFVWHWNDLYSSAMYFVGEVRPIMPVLNDLRTILIQNGLTGTSSESWFSLRLYFSSGALLAVFPPLVMYVFLQKYFVEGIAKTGITG